MIRVSFSLFFAFFCSYVSINFYKNHFIISIIFFHGNYFYFFMSWDVPGRSGIFQIVPACSGIFLFPGFVDAHKNALYI